MRKVVTPKGKDPAKVSPDELEDIAGGNLAQWDLDWLADLYFEFVPHEIGWDEIPEETVEAMSVIGNYLLKKGKIKRTDLPSLERYGEEKAVVGKDVPKFGLSSNPVARELRETMELMVDVDEDVVKFPMKQGVVKKQLDQIFRDLRPVNKAGNLEDAARAEVIKDMTPELAAAIGSLKTITRDEDEDFLADVDAGGDQFYILKQGKHTFLVDTQGFDYPRYVLKMPTTSSRGLGDIKGSSAGDKDVQRILDMKTKANGNEAKIIQLATNMAKAINSRSKAQRRADAALKVLDGKLAKQVYDIFMDKAPKAANESLSESVTGQLSDKVMDLFNEIGQVVAGPDAEVANPKAYGYNLGNNAISSIFEIDAFAGVAPNSPESKAAHKKLTDFLQGLVDGVKKHI